ncbi:MAG: efflux transporter outer membrane subunit [Pontixanthobacter sp.]
MRQRRGGRLLGSAAIATLLSGCAALPGQIEPIAAPSVSVPPEWSVPSAGTSADISDYWRLLNDPLLTEFIVQAQAGNLDLAEAAARLDRARAGVAAARAGLLPSISGTGGLRRDFGDFADDDFNVTVGADADWEVDLFGRIGASVDAARADLAAAGYSLADLQRLIVGNVASSTISARSIAQQIAIARDTLANQDDNLQIARWRLQAGLVSSLDVEQARVQRAQTAASIPALQSDLAATANTISTLIGEPPGRVLALLTPPAAIPDPPRDLGFAVPAAIIQRRPDVRGAEAILAADLARIGVARAQLLPALRLNGTIGTGGLGVGTLFDIITGNLFAGISQLIFDGERTRAQIASAQAQADGSLAAYRGTILQVLEEVETAQVDFATARERRLILEEAREAAENAAILARSQYQAGLVDFQILLTAENQLLSARQSLVTADSQRALAFVRLTQALGGGWSPGEFAPIAPMIAPIAQTGNDR